ncbi:MAG: sugar phosphate isomerase/epimerase [Verrucomicrobia bacterium]|nr:sugar phosphate isomerase/epimerase [Verrucomicrobiota bacterium]
MKTNSNLNRRQFLKHTAAFAAAATALPGALSGAATDKTGPWKICAFEKPLQFLSYDETADFIAELGYQGIEATVRPGGHVLPERVEDDLPKLVEALKKRGLEITILTSGVNSVKQPHTEKVLRTAAKLGIQRYRMLWWRYDLKQPIWPQMEALRPVLKDLVALNRDAGISGLYQNHAGANMVGASLWDIYSLIKDYDPKDIGLAYDIRHAQVEAALAWPAQLQLVQSHVTAVCVKDYDWVKGRVRTVPLGAGRVDKKVMAQLRASGFAGPLSVHVEYDGGSRDRKFLSDAFRNDLNTLKDWLNPV